MLKVAAGAALVGLVVWGATKLLGSGHHTPGPVEPPPAPVTLSPDGGTG